MGNTDRHILIVEDSTVLAVMLRRTLQAAGFRVTIARDGRDAWSKVQTAAYDVIVTDQQMPVMSGVELCEKIRQLEGYQQTPVIMITAKAYELDAQRMHDDLQIAAIFMKPFSPTQVRRAIEESVSAIA